MKKHFMNSKYIGWTNGRAFYVESRATGDIEEVHSCQLQGYMNHSPLGK